MVLNFPSQKHSVYIFVSDESVLTLYRSPIPVVQEYKYLGLIFDKKLSFIPHIKYLKTKCLKSLNILKVLSHTTLGAD